MSAKAPESLTIYKASAGSGKTFTLALRYIVMLIRQPMSYRSTLAVTFTNKATDEMKQRILSQLYGIWQRLPSSDDYMRRITTELNISEAIASQRAGIALRYILNDYSLFRIETIDSFFQVVLRNLARELNIAAKLRIDLRDVEIERQAVAEMVDELDEHDDALRRMVRLAEEKIGEGKSWDVVKDLQAFGANIFKDCYRLNSKRLEAALQDDNSFNAFCDELERLKREAKETMQGFAKRFEQILASNALTVDDFSYKASGPCSYFLKLADERFLGKEETLIGKRLNDALAHPDKWAAAKSPNCMAVRRCGETQLAPLFHEAERKREPCVRQYLSADEILKRVDSMRLLSRIESKIRSMNAENNRFLLSDTQALLHTIIGNNDAPFIYEKIGARLDSIMIDEFQDTSIVQWRNFKVLLDECLSRSQQGSLIVGDVKQSIYRWRGSDWRLLNDIEQQFAQHTTRMRIESLDTNYRSAPAVVLFNNDFFRRAVELAADNVLQVTSSTTHAESLRRAYGDVIQKMRNESADSGYVEVTIIEKKDETLTLEHTCATIHRLLDAGYKQCDIAILVRRTTTADSIVRYMAHNEPDIRMVSNDTFVLKGSTAVSIIIAAMSALLHPDDTLSRKYLIKAYQRHVLGNDITDNDLYASEQSETAFLPSEYTERAAYIAQKPLYEMAENIMRIFQLKRLRRETAYITAFFDCIQTFIDEHSADAREFIDEWNEHIANQAIEPSSIDGIRLLTIHKSKGLEFPNVILPACDWTTGFRRDDRIWCTPKEPPYSTIPLIPVGANEKLLRTIFADDYREEYLQNAVDNLNLLYVAFTRAEKNLFITTCAEQTNSVATTVVAAVNDMPMQRHEANIEEVSPHERSTNGEATTPIDDSDMPAGNVVTTLYTGQFTPPTRKVSKQSDNILMQDEQPIHVEIYSSERRPLLIESNAGRAFRNDDGQDAQSDRYINTGLVLHHVFELIATTADIDNAVLQIECEGLLHDTGMTAEQLTRFLLERTSTGLPSQWFDGRSEVMNEASILTVDAETGLSKTWRPDRVMLLDGHVIVVDFKFGIPRAAYKKQVSNYASLLRSMGYSRVKAYLWYVFQNQIEEVGDD